MIFVKINNVLKEVDYIVFKNTYFSHIYNNGKLIWSAVSKIWRGRDKWKVNDTWKY